MPKNKPKNPRQKILGFRGDFLDRYGTEDPSLVSDVGQVLALYDARLQMVCLLLDVKPEIFIRWLDKLIWHDSLSEETIDSARNEAGIPIPPISALNSLRRPYTDEKDRSGGAMENA